MVDPRTGVLWEAKVVTGVDDHSRYAVMAAVVARASSRAVCLAFAQALHRYGVPEEVITDNGKQFTARFGRYAPRPGEVLFDKICRKNGITHRLTEPQSPNQNGKVERFHGTFRPDFLAVVDPFPDLASAQAAVDAWVAEYNTDRPHQALDDRLPVTPDQRFAPVPDEQNSLVELWLPPSLQPVAPAPDPATGQASVDPPDSVHPQNVHAQEDFSTGLPEAQAWAGGAIEFDRVVPPSGNLGVAGKQFWLGPHRAGVTVRFWADVDVIHLLVAGVPVKSLRSHLSVTDLRRLLEQGAVNAGPPPLPRAERGEAVEVDRVVSRHGSVSLASRAVVAAEILAGRQVGIRIEPDVLMFSDPTTRELLRTRPNPLTAAQIAGLRGARTAGPPPRPSIEPIRVQRRVSTNGTIMVAGQNVALGRVHRGQTVTVSVADTTLAVELEDGEVRVIRRTTDQPVRSIKGQRPRTATVV